MPTYVAHLSGFDRIRKSIELAERLALESEAPVKRGNAEPLTEGEFLKFIGALASVRRSHRKDYIGLEMLGQYSGVRRVKVVYKDGVRVVQFFSHQHKVKEIVVAKKVCDLGHKIKQWLVGNGDVKSL